MLEFTNLTAEEPEAVKSHFLITSIKVETKFGRDHLTLWNRGACSGTLIVREGDGLKIADLLIRDNNFWRML